MFHFHKYSDWSIVEKGRVVENGYSHKQIASYLLQERFCHKCGKTQIDMQMTEKFKIGSFELKPETKRLNVKHDKVE